MTIPKYPNAALYSSCYTLVNSDGILAPEGQRALGRIRNGVMLAGSAGLLGVPVPPIIKAAQDDIIIRCAYMIRRYSKGVLSHLLP